MPGFHCSEDWRRAYDTHLAELNQRRTKVDARVVSLEREIYKATTYELRREQREAEEDAALDALDAAERNTLAELGLLGANNRLPSLAELAEMGQPLTLEEDGRF